LNNLRCKSIRTNVEAHCIFQESARDLILFPLDRADSVEQKSIFQKKFSTFLSAHIFEMQKTPKTSCNHLNFKVAFTVSTR